MPADAHEMVDVLSADELYGFTGGSPPSLERLEAQYRAQVAGPAAGDEVWHNWILRLAGPVTAVGFVQATVVDTTADVAWVVGLDWQGQGYATEAAKAMCDWLAGNGVNSFTAHIHPEHLVSESVATAIGLAATGEVDDDGEVVWANADGLRRGHRS